MLAVYCEKVGEMPLRIYLTNRVLVEESGTVLLDERRLMGRQGRLAFAYLVGERLRAVSRDELAEELWLGAVPPPWERSLSALISKLRALLASADIPDVTLPVPSATINYCCRPTSGSTWKPPARPSTARKVHCGETNRERLGDGHKWLTRSLEGPS